MPPIVWCAALPRPPEHGSHAPDFQRLLHPDLRRPRPFAGQMAGTAPAPAARIQHPRARGRRPGRGRRPVRAQPDPGLHLQLQQRAADGLHAGVFLVHRAERQFRQAARRRPFAAAVPGRGRRLHQPAGSGRREPGQDARARSAVRADRRLRHPDGRPWHGRCLGPGFRARIRHPGRGHPGHCLCHLRTGDRRPDRRPAGQGPDHAPQACRA